MKSYNHLWENMIEPENVRQCILDAAKGKKKRKSVQYVLDKIDYNVKHLTNLLENEKIKTVQNEKVFVMEGSRDKIRTIEKPHFKYEQIIHHLLLSQLTPIIEKSQYQHSYACIPGRGVHKAKRMMQFWVNAYKGKKFYVAELDIKECFKSIDLELLFKKYQKKIRDQKFLRLLERNIFGRYNPTLKERKMREGLPLGSCTSPWHCNFYLQELDYYILQQLKPDHYLRYMDNMYLFGRSKKELHRMVREIESYLQEKLHLKLKGDWQVYRFEYRDRNGQVKGRAINALGFVIHHNRITLRKSIIYKIRKRVNKVAKKVRKKKKVNYKNATAILSSLGWFKHASCYGYYMRYIDPKINKKQLKKIVREHQKEEERKLWKTSYRAGKQYKTAGNHSQKKSTPHLQTV